MKELYKSPVITVEELFKVDVLCASTGTGEGGNDPVVSKLDNAEKDAASITTFQSLF